MGKGSKLVVPPRGSRGLLVTCDKGRVNQALHQVISLCEKYCGTEEVVQEMSLEEELKTLNEPKKSRFVSYISEVTGNFFLRFSNENDDPFVVMEKYFAELKETKQSLTPKVTRIYPILYSGFPSSEESLPIMQELVSKAFSPEKPLTYEVVLHRKHCGNSYTESHDEMNKKILQIIGPPHKAVYHHGEAGVIWHSLGRNLYLSIIPKWSEWCQCNIPKFCSNGNE